METARRGWTPRRVYRRKTTVPPAKLTDADKAVLMQLHDYPLQPGQMLLLGPLSCAYIGGDYQRAPWLMPHVKAPGGNRLPDKHVIEKTEWNAGEWARSK